MIMSFCQWHPAVSNQILRVWGAAEVQTQPPLPLHTSKPCHRLAFSLTWLKLMVGWHDCDLYGFLTLAGTVPRLHVSSAFLTNPPGSPRNPRCRMHNLRGGRQSIPKNTNDMGGREKGRELQREGKKRAAAKLPGCVRQQQSSALTSNPGMSFLSWHETSAKPEKLRARRAGSISLRVNTILYQPDTAAFDTWLPGNN